MLKRALRAPALLYAVGAGRLLGRRSGWFLNALAGGAEEVRIGGSAFRLEVRELDLDEAVCVLGEYEQRNRLLGPLARMVLSRLAGLRYDGSDVARRDLVARLPMIGLRDVRRAPR